MRTPPLIITPAEDQSWRPVTRCCWCRSEFVRRTVIDRLAWVCPNDECYARQFKWKILDIDGGLFYLPMPKQVVMEEAVASQLYAGICIGGARGGGKSGGMRPLAYRYCKALQNFTVIILRRMFPELKRNHIAKAQREVKRLGAKLANNIITFPETDATIEFGHCQDTDDYKQYIGAEADLIIFDQLEDFEELQFTEISAAAGRISRDDWRGLVLAGENPGGPLSDFVDKFFLSKDLPKEKYPDYDPTQYFFIESALEDNPNVDKRYVNFLSTMSAEKREMYRWGRRDIFPGQFFKSFQRDDRVQLLDVSRIAGRIGGLHWAFNKKGMYLWAVVLPDGRLYIECEYEFTETAPDDLAAEVLEISAKRKLTIMRTFGNPPSDVPEGQIGEDAFEVLHRSGLPVARSRHHDVSGWQRLQQWLKSIKNDSGDEVPALILSPECEILASALPKLLQDDDEKENILGTDYDHAPRALRYIVMSRPAVALIRPAQQSRDLSNFDAKTRRDIERLNRFESSERGRDIGANDASFPWGDLHSVADPDKPW